MIVSSGDFCIKRSEVFCIKDRVKFFEGLSKAPAPLPVSGQINKVAPGHKRFEQPVAEDQSGKKASEHGTSQSAQMLHRGIAAPILAPHSSLCKAETRDDVSESAAGTFSTKQQKEQSECLPGQASSTARKAELDAVDSSNLGQDSEKNNTVGMSDQHFEQAVAEDQSGKEESEYETFSLPEVLKRVSANSGFYSGNELNRQGTYYCGVPGLKINYYGTPAPARIATPILAPHSSLCKAETGGDVAADATVKEAPLVNCVVERAFTAPRLQQKEQSQASSTARDATVDAFKSENLHIAQISRQRMINFMSEEMLLKSSPDLVVIPSIQMPKPDQNISTELSPPLPSSSLPVGQERYAGPKYEGVVEVLGFPKQDEPSSPLPVGKDRYAAPIFEGVEEEAGKLEKGAELILGKSRSRDSGIESDSDVESLGETSDVKVSLTRQMSDPSEVAASEDGLKKTSQQDTVERERPTVLTVPSEGKTESFDEGIRRRLVVREQKNNELIKSLKDDIKTSDSLIEILTNRSLENTVKIRSLAVSIDQDDDTIKLLFELCKENEAKLIMLENIRAKAEHKISLFSHVEKEYRRTYMQSEMEIKSLSDRGQATNTSIGSATDALAKVKDSIGLLYRKLEHKDAQNRMLSKDLAAKNSEINSEKDIAIRTTVSAARVVWPGVPTESVA